MTVEKRALIAVKKKKKMKVDKRTINADNIMFNLRNLSIHKPFHKK